VKLAVDVSTSTEVGCTDPSTAGVAVDELPTTGLAVDKLLTTGVAVDELPTTGLAVDELPTTGVTVDELPTTGLAVDDLPTTRAWEVEVANLADEASDLDFRAAWLNLPLVFAGRAIFGALKWFDPASTGLVAPRSGASARAALEDGLVFRGCLMSGVCFGVASAVVALVCFGVDSSGPSRDGIGVDWFDSGTGREEGNFGRVVVTTGTFVPEKDSHESRVASVGLETVSTAPNRLSRHRNCATRATTLV